MQPVAIDLAFGGQMLRQHTLMKLRALRQDDVRECDTETATLVAKQICKTAPFIILFGRKIGVGHLRDWHNQKPQSESLQHASPSEDPIVSLQSEVTHMPHGNG